MGQTDALARLEERRDRLMDQKIREIVSLSGIPYGQIIIPIHGGEARRWQATRDRLMPDAKEAV